MENVARASAKDVALLRDRLDDLAAQPEVMGAVVDVEFTTSNRLTKEGGCPKKYSTGAAADFSAFSESTQA